MKILLITAKTRRAQRRRAQYWAATRRYKRQKQLKKLIDDIRERREGALVLPPVPQLPPPPKISPPEKKNIGIWIPDGLQELVDKHYEKITAVRVAEGRIGDIALSTRLANVLEHYKINGLGRIIDMPISPLPKWRNFGKKSFEELIEVIGQIADEIERTGQIPFHPEIGAWIPEDLGQLISLHYKIITELPIIDGQLEAVEFSTRVANALRYNGIRKAGVIIRLQNNPARVWRNFGKKSSKELIEALRMAATQIVENGPARPSATVSLRNIGKALSFLHPKRKQIIEMRYGFSGSGKPHTLAEVGQAFGLTRERVRQIIEKNRKTLKLPSRKKKLRGMRQSIIKVGSELLKDRIVLSLAELKAELKKRHLLKEQDEPFLVPIMHLLDHIFGQHFTYVYMENGKTAPNVTKGNIWLIRDRQKYLDVLPPFCGQRKDAKESESPVWEFHEYQKMLEEKHKLSVPIHDLHKIFSALRRTRVEGNIFFQRGIEGERLHLVVETIRSGGPLHYTKIAELIGTSPKNATAVIGRRNEFVMIGNGTFDLLEKHPEQKDIPWPDVRRKAHVFAPVYGFLRDAKEGLTMHALHQKMKDSSYKWTEAGIWRILNDEKYRDFFVQIGLGIYALAEYFPELKNIPHSEITRRFPSFAAVYATIKDSEKKPKLSEIHATMRQRGYKWSLGTVERMLSLGVKNNLFVRENQRYGLKSQGN